MGRLRTFVGVTALGFGLACLAGDGTGFEPPPPPPGPSLANDVQPIFTANCALSNCHVAPNPQGPGLSLSAGQTFSNIVNVQPSQVPGVVRVLPFEADQSYLVRKIEGTAGAVGGNPSQMPLGRGPLTQEEMDLIRDWITAGADDN